jgi:hypothetical protein
MKVNSSEFQGLIDQLIEALREELRQNHRLLDVIRKKKNSLLKEAPGDLDRLLRVEREVVTDAVTVERDRICLLTEVGEVLGHPNPSRLRVAEIVLHAHPEQRDELLDLREEIRDVADEVEALNSVEPVFSQHRQDQVRLYVTPSRWKGIGSATKTSASASTSSPPSPPGRRNGARGERPAQAS